MVVFHILDVPTREGVKRGERVVGEGEWRGLRGERKARKGKELREGGSDNHGME